MHPRLLQILIGVALAISAEPARAQFASCPTQDGRRVCQISTERSSLVVAAGSGPGLVLQVESWVVDGVEQMGIEGIRIREQSTGVFLDFEVISAEVALDTTQILIFQEYEEVSITTAFNLRENEDVTYFDIEVYLALAEGEASGLVFLISDLDLGGDPLDAVIEAGAQALPITQSGTGWQTVLTLEQGTGPVGFDVGTAAEFAPLLDNQPVTIDGTEATTGPADLASVTVWYAQLGPSDPLFFRVRRSVVPEPGALRAGGVALLLLGMLAPRRRARARIGPAARHVLS